MRCINQSSSNQIKLLDDVQLKCKENTLNINIPRLSNVCCCIVDKQECRKKYEKERKEERKKYEDKLCKDDKCCTNCEDAFPDLLCYDPRTKQYVAVEVKNTDNVTDYIEDIRRKYEHFILKFPNFSEFIIAVHGKVSKGEEIRLQRGVGRVSIVKLCNRIDLTKV